MRCVKVKRLRREEILHASVLLYVLLMPKVPGDGLDVEGAGHQRGPATVSMREPGKAAPGPGASKDVLAGAGMHFCALVDMVGHVAGSKQAESASEEEAVGSAAKAGSCPGVRSATPYPYQSSCVTDTGEAVVVCRSWAPERTCMPKIPAMRASIPVRIPARRRNTSRHVPTAALMVFLLRYA
ncbi:hypothetical protein M707_08265 [Arthrobacter sp. AK-YN10]|nr:hypothetical protein M707_08265 [Arthrobacter sp. AK-YN10]